MIETSHPRPAGGAQTRRRGVVRPATLTLALAVTILSSGCGRQDAEREPEPLLTAREAIFLPAEFDPQDALLLGAARLFELYPTVLVDIVRAAHDSIRLILLVRTADDEARIRQRLADEGLPAGAVEFRELPIMTMWVRDFGPLTVADLAGHRRFVDFIYRERRGNAIDNDVPVHLAEQLGRQRVDCPILLEGGDILTNGLGLCVGSTRVIDRNAQYLVLDSKTVIQRMAGALGFESVRLVPPLEGETTGHLDMFCAFLQPDLVVVGQYDLGVDPVNSKQLDRIAEDLQGLATRRGPLQVERIPMPPATGDVWRTYTNIILANGVVLVPVYPDVCPDLDAAALDLYRRLLPGRQVVGIDASGLINQRGALRCITMNIAVGSLPGR